LKAVAIQKDVQDRISDHAAILFNVGDVKAAANAARGRNETIRQEGITFDGANEALRALQGCQMQMLLEHPPEHFDQVQFIYERGSKEGGLQAIHAGFRRIDVPDWFGSLTS
jgi:hypothetical protein